MLPASTCLGYLIVAPPLRVETSCDDGKALRVVLANLQLIGIARRNLD